ncbi:hypothetical protein DN402_34135 [Streptomyces sp. SW4]|nr:hypothetical protein DN402_34135 [Streptomyces sp. SW4]
MRGLVIALAVAVVVVVVPGQHAVAARAGLDFTSPSGDYTLKAVPSVDLQIPPEPLYLNNTGGTEVTSYTVTVDYSSLAGMVEVVTPFWDCRKKSEGVLVCEGTHRLQPGTRAHLGGSGCGA